MLPYPLQRSWEVTIRGLPDIKSPPSWFINHSTGKKAFRPNFFGRFTAACVARGGGRSPKRAVCAAHNISTATYHAWKRKFGGMEVSEAKRLRGKLAA